MLSAKTVFVVGAGASFEVGLPLGRKLKETIAQKLDLRLGDFGTPMSTGDLDIFETLRRRCRGNEIHDYLQVCRDICGGVALSPSIDDYIDNHQHDPRVAMCGKLAIFRSIAEAEMASKLYFVKKNVVDTINFSSLQNTWYIGFYELLSNRVPLSKLDSIFNNVTIVTFNYDRCIEQFLTHAIAENYRIQIEEARERVAKLLILRPYGDIGLYFGKPNEILHFGNTKIPDDLDDVIDNLMTYTEHLQQESIFLGVSRAIREAEVIVFLGNHFHENNMNMLAPRSQSKLKRIYATRRGISEPDLEVVRKRLWMLCGTEHSAGPFPVHFAETCKDLFDMYRMSLAQS